MQVRRIVPLAAVGVLAAGAFMPATAAPAKPITKTYEMQQLPGGCVEDGGELTMHLESFTATVPGKLTATIEGFEGDWDLGLRNADGAEIAAGGGSSTGAAAVAPVERLIYKITKPGKYTVSSCNYVGTPEATGSYLFEPGKK